MTAVPLRRGGWDADTDTEKRACDHGSRRWPEVSTGHLGQSVSRASGEHGPATPGRRLGLRTVREDAPAAPSHPLWALFCGDPGKQA